MKKILILIAAAMLTSCGTTYKASYETPTIGGVPLDKVPNRAVIRVGRNNTTITEKNTPKTVKRTVANEGVKVENGAVVVRHTDRIVVKYE